MRARNFFAPLVFMGVALFGCSPSPVEKALAGRLVPSEANVVISEHCRGCHVHSQFRTEPHIASMRVRFPEKNPLRQATQCLQCHDLKLKGMFRKEDRATTRPHGNVIEMANIPLPGGVEAGKTAGGDKKKEASKKGAPEKKERRWYFFYLF